MMSKKNHKVWQLVLVLHKMSLRLGNSIIVTLYYFLPNYPVAEANFGAKKTGVTGV